MFFSKWILVVLCLTVGVGGVATVVVLSDKGTTATTMSDAEKKFTERRSHRGPVEEY